MKKIHYILGVCIVALLLQSCFKDEINNYAGIRYTPTIALPLADATLKLQDLLREDSVLTVGTDNSLSLMYSEPNLFTLGFQELSDELKDQFTVSTSERITIGSIAIADFSENVAISFGNMVANFSDATLRQSIQAADGNTARIPSFSENVQLQTSLPTITTFNQVTFEQGILAMTIENGLPIDIQNLTIELLDLTTNTTVGAFDFMTLASGETVTKQISLVGKQWSNKLTYRMPSLSTQGSSGMVPINLEDELKIDLAATDLVVSSGVAQIPATDILEEQLVLNIDSEEDIKLVRLDMKTAQLDYSIQSDWQGSFDIRLEFPSIMKNGTMLTETINVAYTGQNNQITGTIDLKETIIWLNQGASPAYNRIPVNYTVTTPNTSQMVAFNASDAVQFEFELTTDEMSYIQGYFGEIMRTIEPQTIDLGYDFSQFDESSAPLYFDNPQIKITINNSFGLPLSAFIDMTAIGADGGMQSLQAPSLILNYPTLDNPNQVAKTDITFNKRNTAIVDLLSIYPNQLNYTGEVTANKGNEPNDLTNFVTENSELSVGFTFDLPFRFRTESLVFRDTIEALDITEEQLDNFEAADLLMHYANQFPLQTTLHLKGIEASGNEVTIIDGLRLEAAVPNADGYVPIENTRQDSTTINLVKNQFQQLSNAKQLVTELTLNTTSEQEAVGIYTDYQIQLNLGLQLQLKLDF